MQQNDCRGVGAIRTVVTHCQADAVTRGHRPLDAAIARWLDAVGRNAAGARPVSGATDMVDSSVGVDVGKVPDTLMRPKLRTGRDGGSLVRTSRASGNFELLRIVLSGLYGAKVVSPAAIFDARQPGVSTTRKRQQNVCCAACAHKRANARAAP